MTEHRSFASDRQSRLLGEECAPWRAAPPGETALRIVTARFGERWAAGEEGPGPVFPLMDFQEDAVRQATEILALRRGVLVADSVGLGKTYVALALLERELRRGGRTLVVVPAALLGAWSHPLRRLCGELGVTRTWGVARTPRDDPEGTDVDNPDRTGASAALVSHARLSRGTFPADRLAGADLVVVDEAHAFRSPGTRRYRALATLCRGARVVLLSATPVNNALSDLYFQLRLFAGDGAFRDLGVPDLAEAFRTAGESGEEGAGAVRPLRAVLDAVMIRRTRPLLRTRLCAPRRQGGERPAPGRFPQRAAPVPVRYDIDSAYPDIHTDAAAVLESLTLAPLRLGAYGADARGDAAGVEVLLRLGLLKRLESSVAAFRASLRRQTRYLASCLDALARGRLLAPLEHRLLHAAGGDDDVVQLLLDEVVLAPLPPGLDAARLQADLRSDLVRLRRLLERLAPVADERDPKLLRLLELLDRELRGEKAVVFTEFRETARTLWRALLPRGRVALVDGGGAFLGRSGCGRRQVIERFAPRANGVPPPPPHERVDLLVATDVLAEGLNLQDARCVVSYDLPWNPVRLIQRVGRVDRLGSPFETVFCYHFLPARGLEEMLGLLARLRAKLAAIGRSVGAEGPVLGEEGEARVPLEHLVDRLAAGDPDVLDALERHATPPAAWEERLRAVFEEVRPRDAAARTRPRGSGHFTGESGGPGPVACRPVSRRPPVAALAAAPGVAPQVLVACRAAGRVRWLLVRAEDATPREDDRAAAEILVRALSARAEAALPVDDGAIALAFGRATAWIETRLAALGGPEPLPPSSIAARATRVLLAALDAVPGGPDPVLCRRADAILATLAVRRDAGTEAAVRAALRGFPTASEAGSPGQSATAEAIIAGLERVLQAAPAGLAPATAKFSPVPTSGHRPPSPPEVEMLGAIALCRIEGGAGEG